EILKSCRDNRSGSILAAPELSCVRISKMGQRSSITIWALVYLALLAQFANAAGGEVPDKEIRDIAAQILDDNRTEDEREALIAKHPAKGTELVLAMARDIPNSTEEYRRIPWIWRVAVACGKRNRVDQIKPMLEATLPNRDEQLR